MQTKKCLKFIVSVCICDIYVLCYKIVKIKERTDVKWRLAFDFDGEWGRNAFPNRMSNFVNKFIGE